MGEYTPGLPVDMNAIDEVAATATQGGEQAEAALDRFRDAHLQSLEASRSNQFFKGQSEAKVIAAFE